MRFSVRSFGYALFILQKEGTHYEKSIIPDLGTCDVPVSVCLRRQHRRNTDSNHN
jgi:hypothetical protein